MRTLTSASQVLRKQLLNKRANYPPHSSGLAVRTQKENSRTTDRLGSEGQGLSGRDAYTKRQVMFSEGRVKEGAFLAGRSAVLRPWSQREHSASGSSGGSQTQEGKDPCQREATAAGQWKHRGPKSLPSRGGACGVWDAATTPQGYDAFITESAPVTAGRAGFQARKRRKSCTTEPSLLLSSLLLSFTAEENRGLSWKQQSVGPSSGSSQVAASGALWEDREETHHPKPTISFQHAKPTHV